MGFLDRILATLGRRDRADSPAPDDDGTPSRTPAGPLHLAIGDFVTHYRDRFAVVGFRCLEGDGLRVWHYCLRDSKGARAVIAAEEGDQAQVSVQRPVAADVDASGETVSHPELGEGPFQSVRRGQMAVRSWGETGVGGGARTMRYRVYQDAEGDRLAFVEEYQGAREVRVGTAVLDTELAVDHGEGDVADERAALSEGAEAFEAEEGADVPKGSPRAAARVLTRNVGVKSEGPVVPMSDEDAREDYDEEWADARDVDPVAAARPHVARRPRDDDEDEWISASQFAKGPGGE